jgi:hypothetical protein
VLKSDGGITIDIEVRIFVVDDSLNKLIDEELIAN